MEEFTNILEDYIVEIFLRDKRTLLTTPIKQEGSDHSAYDIFKPEFIKALEKIIEDDRKGGNIGSK